MHRQFSVALRHFPFSVQLPQAYLRVSAIDPGEPALAELYFELPGQLDELFEEMAKWSASDAAFEVEGFWDLWQETAEGWRLKPSRVHLFLYGPEYPSDEGESMRVELGLEAAFVPEVIEPKSVAYFQSNIKSLVQLMRDWTDHLAILDRRLDSETEGNLEARLSAVVGDSSNFDRDSVQLT